MNKPNIILTGFMGSGKTTIGKIIAKTLHYDFVDTDQLIEKRHTTTIQRIFATKGEEAFRKMEADLAKELSTRKATVIATGGGLMIRHENSAILSPHGYVFCLTVTPKETLQRLTKAKQAKRPLLEVANPLTHITKLLVERSAEYNRFTQITTSARSPQEVAKEILDIVLSTPL